MWPFLGGSLVVGIAALLPYLVLWEPSPKTASPPRPQSLVRGSCMHGRGGIISQTHTSLAC